MELTTREARLAQLFAELERDAEVISGPAERAWAEIPTYAHVTREQIEAATTRNREMALRALRSGRAPSLDETWHAQQATLDRLQSGVPIEDIMRGFRFSITMIESRLIDLADQCGVPGEDVVPLIRLLSQFSDILSAAGAAAYREHGLALAVTERRRRDDWLAALLAGTLDEAQTEQGATRYQLSREASYLAICARPADDAVNDRAARMIAAHFHAEDGVLLYAGRGRLVGLLPDVPPAVPELLIAAGPPVRLGAVASSYDTALRILSASADTERGVCTVGDLGWRIGVPFVAELADLVRERYLDPLYAMGQLGEVILEDLRAYLQNGRSIPRAAAVLHVHVNTLRYRIARFEEVTGCALSETDTLIELAWALRLDSRSS